MWNKVNEHGFPQTDRNENKREKINTDANTKVNVE